MPRLVVHPILWAVAPVLLMFAQNAATFVADVLITPMLVVLTATLGVWLATGLALRSVERSAILVSLGLMVLFSYGYLREFATRNGVGDAPDAWLVPLVFGVWAVGTWACLSLVRDTWVVTRVLHVMAAVFLVIPLSNIALHGLGPKAVLRPSKGAETAASPRAGLPGQLPPNIYYIVLDEYARADVLVKVFGYDNSPLLAFLESRGFYVANESFSNYPHTALSIASTLNFDYLQNMFSSLPAGAVDLLPLRAVVQNNRAFDVLRRHGYHVASFASGNSVTELETADSYYRKGSTLSEFDGAVLNMTPLAVLWRQLVRRNRKQFDQYHLHRQRISYAFENMASLDLRAPFLVFAHILAPHPPFVFGRNGEPIDSKLPFTLRPRLTRAIYVEGYRNQLHYVNARLMQTIDAILAAPGRSPVILIHADHGSGAGWLDLWRDEGSFETDDPEILWERMAILNAYHLPDGGDARLYPGISPVNTLRVVFDHYLGLNLGLLEDQSYFSTAEKPFDIQDVTETIRAEARRSRKIATDSIAQ